jgi:hypothetical protein
MRKVSEKMSSLINKHIRADANGDSIFEGKKVMFQKNGKFFTCTSNKTMNFIKKTYISSNNKVNSKKK